MDCYNSSETLKWHQILLVTVHIVYLVCKAIIENGSTNLQFDEKLFKSEGRLSRR